MFLACDYAPLRYKVDFPDELSDGLVLSNLEAPFLTLDKTPVKEFKSGPSLFNVVECVPYAHRTQFVFSLANNHIMDYGVAGLTQTISTLKRHNILSFGAGYTIEDARQPLLVTEKSKKIGIIGCRESQFGSQNCADMGWWLFDAVSKLKSCVDYVIVSSHAAAEDSPFPSPALRDYYHRLIDAGVDVIHGHHAHIPQGWENYSGGVIFYGLGNFVVDPLQWVNNVQRTSLIASVDFSGEKLQYSVAKCICESKGKDCVRTSFERKSNSEWERYLSICDKALSTESNVWGYWQEMATRLYEETYGAPLRIPAIYNTKISPLNRISYARDALTIVFQAIAGIKKTTARSRSLAASVYNSIQCLSHSEMLKSAIGIALGNEKDFRTPEIIADCDVILGYFHKMEKR